jgi:pyruvate/2-oxoglutarate dehydrogenase complex dihydrolipoamide dehydrogenase (E3) component
MGEAYDMVIIGGGPAGVTAALRARELGARVALVERGRMGGTCTNDGCVPTRVLAKAARLIRDFQQFDDYGLMVTDKPTVDFAAVLKRAQQVVYQIHEKKQLLDHLNSVGVDVYSEVGTASFIDANHIKFGDTILESRYFTLCVGGSARRLDIPGAEYAFTHSDVWMMDKLPASVVVVGGGATGCQLGSIFQAFGSYVTLMDIAPRILLTEDNDVAAAVAHEVTTHGTDIITGIESLERIEKHNNMLHLFYRKDDQEHALEVEAIVLSVGWPGNLEELNLQAAGVETERSYVRINDTLQTTTLNIFAAGDITGRIMLVQSAQDQARVAVENALLGEQHAAEFRLVPHGGFTNPEYAGVGMTEEQARKELDVVVATVPYADLDRAVIDGHPVGFCKLIVDKGTRLVVGAHVVGEQAVEVVQMVAAGIAGKLPIEEFADLELAYPTFASIVGLAARQLVRELGLVKISREWHALKREPRGAEWERAIPTQD